MFNSLISISKSEVLLAKLPDGVHVQVRRKKVGVAFQQQPEGRHARLRLGVDLTGLYTPAIIKIVL